MTRMKIAMFLATLMGVNLAVDAYEETSLYEELNWGSWGPWFQNCSFCLGMRQRYNCTREEKVLGLRAEEMKICHRGVYFEKINNVLDGCFNAVEGSSSIENYATSDNFIIPKLMSKSVWNTEGEKKKCVQLRGYEKKRLKFLNRRGNQKVEYKCDTDGMTVWREQWQHCCAGSWTQWTAFDKCIPGQRNRRYVRICSVANVTLNVIKLVREREFLTDWKQEKEQCATGPKNKESSPQCSDICSTDSWENNSVCKWRGKEIFARKCCIPDRRGLRSSCKPQKNDKTFKNNDEKTTTLVVLVLGTEAVIIVVTAVVIIMYNLGRLPSILSHCCSTGKKAKYKAGKAQKRPRQVRKMSTQSSKRITGYAKNRVRLKIKNMEELTTILTQTQYSNKNRKQEN